MKLEGLGLNNGTNNGGKTLTCGEGTASGSPIKDGGIHMNSNLDNESSIIKIDVNISKKKLEETLTRELGEIPFSLHLKAFDPIKEINKYDEQEKLSIEPIINKIVGLAKDDSYVSVIPVLSIENKYLMTEIEDPNYRVSKRPLTKLSLEKIKSKLVMKGYGFVQNTRADLYVDLQALIAECLVDELKKLNSSITKEDLTTKWSVGMSFNGEDSYTVSVMNKLFVEA